MTGRRRRYVDGTLERTKTGFRLHAEGRAFPVEIEGSCPEGELIPWKVTLGVGPLPVVAVDAARWATVRTSRARVSASEQLNKQLGTPAIDDCAVCGRRTTELHNKRCRDCQSNGERKKKKRKLIDDRDPSRSVRTWSGGAPGLGRRR